MCGSLSKPSKMPCHGYGLSAFKCRTGSKLAKIPGSVCSGCYAMKGNYLFPVVIAAHVTRHEAIASDLGQWTEDMVRKIRKEEHSGYFRWHDSGDVQSPEHLAAIAEIARRLPDILFWLPSKEYDWMQSLGFDIPENLVIRMSHPMIGKAFPMGFRTDKGDVLSTSSVDSGQGYKCPASKQDNKCGSCRACWDKSITNVDYVGH